MHTFAYLALLAASVLALPNDQVEKRDTLQVTWVYSENIDSTPHDLIVLDLNAAGTQAGDATKGTFDKPTHIAGLVYNALGPNVADATSVLPIVCYLSNSEDASQDTSVVVKQFAKLTPLKADTYDTMYCNQNQAA